MENQIVKPLKTVGGEELLEMQLPPKEFVIEGLLPVGLAMLVGSPKVGKSFLSLQTAVAVAEGEKLWSYPTKQGHVLYLALEDDLERLQMRLKNMNDNVSNMLRLSIMSETLHSGLIEQMESFITEYPDTVLIIIDTLQHVRDNTNKQGGNLYAQDYTELMALQRFALDKKLSVMLIHHKNKLKGKDPFEAASGTNGITASLDTYWFLDRPDRDKPQAKLSVGGRDVSDRQFKIELQQNGEWVFIEGEKYKRDKINSYVSLIAFFLHICVWAYQEEPQPFQITATGLVEEIKKCQIEVMFDFNPLKIKKELTAYHQQLENFGILFDGSKRTGKERLLTFTPITEENAPPYYKPVSLFAYENHDDSSDGMTVETDMGEKHSSTVTDANDSQDSNDGSLPLSDVLSQPSLLSQEVKIDAKDPMSFLAKIMEQNLSASGINVTPFEEFCKQQEEKERKKYIDVKLSEEADSADERIADDKNVFALSGKNRVDANVRFIKAFLLKARLNCA